MAPHVALAAPHEVKPHAVAMLTPPAFPDASTPVPVTGAEHVIPTRLLAWTVRSWSRDGPAPGGLLMRIPPQTVAPDIPGPFPVTMVLRMSKPAPSRRIPPPGLLTTETWLSRSVAPLLLARTAVVIEESFRSLA